MSIDSSNPSPATELPLGLGLDVGGTATRWAIACAGDDAPIATGAIGGLTALMAGNDNGRTALAETLGTLATRISAAGHVMPTQVVAGFSGYSDDVVQRLHLEALLAGALGVPPGGVRVLSDITLAYLGCFRPGEGCLVYAGTGSIALCIDSDGQVHRAGGRGSLLDDGGSGYWIAREALQQIWRAEDESPGCWRSSPLAIQVFDQIGDSSWPGTRHFVYQGTRGQIGELALAVAAAGRAGDPDALGILRRAGRELARLALALARRQGSRPVALAGRAAQLHPAILDELRACMAGHGVPQQVELQSHIAAARLAAGQPPILDLLPDAGPAK